MNEEFLKNLKESFMILDDRIKSLEHMVNDIIIGSLKESAEEYTDNENYATFQTNYDPLLADLVEPYKVLCGDDFDLSRTLYDNLKEAEGYGTDGFDEKALIEAKIAEIKDKLAKLETIKKEVNKEEGGAEEVIGDEPKEEIPSEAQLAQELAEAKLR